MLTSELPVRRVMLAALKISQYLGAYRFAAPGAEPDIDELERALRAGRQPYHAVVSGDAVLFGSDMLGAALRAGRKSVSVTERPDPGDLDDACLGLIAAGLHLRALAEGCRLDPFDRRLAAARLYRAWATRPARKSRRRRLGRTGREWHELRASLIAEAFGRSQRSLLRDARLLAMPAELLDAVRRGLLPERDVEPAANLGPAEQLELAGRLAGGGPLGGGREGYFGPPVRRKTAPGARRAVLAAIATIVSEANTLAGESPLATRGDHGGARAASALLTGWLAVPPPGPGGGRLAEALLELGRIDGGPQGTVGGAS